MSPGRSRTVSRRCPLPGLRAQASCALSRSQSAWKRAERLPSNRSRAAAPCSMIAASRILGIPGSVAPADVIEPTPRMRQLQRPRSSGEAQGNSVEFLLGRSCGSCLRSRMEERAGVVSGLCWRVGRPAARSRPTAPSSRSRSSMTAEGRRKARVYEHANSTVAARATPANSVEAAPLPAAAIRRDRDRISPSRPGLAVS